MYVYIHRHIGTSGLVFATERTTQTDTNTKYIYVYTSYVYMLLSRVCVCAHIIVDTPLGASSSGKKCSGRDIIESGHKNTVREKVGVYWYLFSNHCTRKCIHKRVISHLSLSLPLSLSLSLSLARALSHALRDPREHFTQATRAGAPTVTMDVGKRAAGWIWVEAVGADMQTPPPLPRPAGETERGETRAGRGGEGGEG